MIVILQCYANIAVQDYDVSLCVLVPICSDQKKFAIGMFINHNFNIQVMFLLSISKF